MKTSLNIPDKAEVKRWINEEMIKKEKLISREELRKIIDLEIRKNNEVFNNQMEKMRKRLNLVELK